ncbi:kinetoplast-associated protein-like protein [Leishmania tarentolae]|uniref:Kinetoplast-associated protein-like protein n=1 Tax=Leishmania tarentolae TaxID=5689 RepID=A0A640KPU0_LEITA|nr:kinetoplast-associated protein-like protein [Leishmania tarentolae]
MAPRRSRAKRLHLPGAARCLAAQPSAAPHVAVSPPMAPQPTPIAPAMKPSRSVEPPVVTYVQQASTSVEPAATVSGAPIVEETPVASASNTTSASTVCIREHTAEMQCSPNVGQAPVTETASAVPAGEEMPPTAPVSAAPSAQPPEASIRVHRRRLRAKRRAAAALARKAKQHRNTISAPQQAVSPSTSSQPPAPAATQETVTVAQVETPAAEAEAQQASITAAPNSAQAGTTVSELAEPKTNTVMSSPPASPPIATPHRSTISRIPKKRKFFAELDDTATETAADATPLPANSERHLPASHTAEASLSPTEAPPTVPPVTTTTTVEGVTNKTSAVSDALPAPAAAHRRATHRISKVHAKAAAVKLKHNSGNLASYEATLEAAPAAISAVTGKMPAFGSATLTLAEKPAAATAPAVPVPSVEPPQRSASSKPQSTAPQVTSSAAVTRSGRATISRVVKKRKHLVDPDKSPLPDTSPSTQETSTVPEVADAAVTLNGVCTAATTAAAEPAALTVETAVAHPAAAIVVEDGASTKATARRRSMRRGKLPPQAAVAEAPPTAKAPPSEATAPTPVTPAVEAMTTSMPQAAQGAKVAASAESTTDAGSPADAARPVESATPPAAVRKLRSSKKPKRLTAAAIRRRELAAYNRIPKRFRPPEVPRLALSTPAAESEESTPATASVPATTIAVEAVDANEAQQPAAVGATQTKRMEAAAEMRAEAQTPTLAEGLGETPARQVAQPSAGTSTVSKTVAEEPAAPLTESTKSAAPLTTPEKEQCLMGQARVATKSMKVRIAQTLKKRFFSALEEVPDANPKVEAATQTTPCATEAPAVVPQAHAAAHEEIELSSQVAGNDTTVNAEMTAVVEEAVALESALGVEQQAVSVSSTAEKETMKASQPLANHKLNETSLTEGTSFDIVKGLHSGGAQRPSESVAVDADSPAPTQRKVVRVTNVRDMVKAIRKAKRAKRGASKKRLCNRPLAEHPMATVTGAVDEVVNAVVKDAESDAALAKEAEAVAAVQETDIPSETEQQGSVCAQAAEITAEMVVETTTVVTPEVMEVCSTEPVDKEAVHPPEALQDAEVLVPPTQAAVATPVNDFLPRAISSPSLARRQAAKQKIKKHAKLAAARLRKRPTYIVSAAEPLVEAHAPAEVIDAPLVEAVHAAAEPPVLPAEEASAETLVRRSALVLPSGNVVVESFTENEMVLRRTTLDDSWGVGLRFDWQERTLAISSFPPFEAADKRSAHPFVQQFKSRPRWLLKEVNETSAAHMKKALDSMNRSLTARFVFRHLK